VKLEVKSEKKRIEVLATDGVETRRLIWVEQCEDGSFYWGVCIPKGDFHSSYHASGRMHFSKYHEAQIWEKIAHFKGVRQLCFVAIFKDLSKIHNSPYERKKLDGVAYVDVRTLKGNQISISLHLVEKGNTEFVESFNKIFKNPTISLFTFTNPWVAIAVY
jgi:hypothetical protein